MFEQRPDSINRSFRHLQSEELSHQLQPCEFPLQKAWPNHMAGTHLRTSTKPDSPPKIASNRHRPTQTRSNSPQRATDNEILKTSRGHDGLGMYLSDALETPLLTRVQEQELAQRIFRYRQAFQRIILKEPGVLDYLVELLSRWEAGKLRIDAFCNLGLSEVEKRRLLEPKIRRNLKSLKRLRKSLGTPSSAQSSKRRQARIIRLVEALQLRPQTFESAPFESGLANQLQQQCRLLCQALTRANMRLVVRIANQICGNSPALMDMIQEGNQGLMHAVTKFDHRSNNRFSTYATPWIKQAILGALPNAQRNIRVPENYRAISRKVKKRVNDIRKRNFEFRDSDSGREICLIATELKLQPIEFEQHLRIQRDTCSLDQPVRCETGNSNAQSNLGDVLPDYRRTNPALIAQTREQKNLVRSLMKQSLTRREHDVISLRFGMNDGHARSFAEVGRQMGLTRQRVCQVEKQALEKLGNVTRRLDLAM